MAKQSTLHTKVKKAEEVKKQADDKRANRVPEAQREVRFSRAVRQECIKERNGYAADPDPASSAPQSKYYQPQFDTDIN